MKKSKANSGWDFLTTVDDDGFNIASKRLVKSLPYSKKVVYSPNRKDLHKFSEAAFERPSWKDVLISYEHSVITDVVGKHVESLSSYHVIESRKCSTAVDDHSWGVWNDLMVGIVDKYSGLLGDSCVSSANFFTLIAEIPSRYTIKTKLDLLGEFFEDCDEENLGISPKSLLSVIRYIPIFEERREVCDFYVDDNTGRIGVSMSQEIGAGARKTLDLIFSENGEILFSFMEGGEGYSRISGSSYLTSYLVNSYKIRKIFSIFD